MADDDLFRFLARLPAEQYARLRNFLLGKDEADDATQHGPKGDVTSHAPEADAGPAPQRKKPRT